MQHSNPAVFPPDLHPTRRGGKTCLLLCAINLLALRCAFASQSVDAFIFMIMPGCCDTCDTCACVCKDGGAIIAEGRSRRFVSLSAAAAAA